MWSSPDGYGSISRTYACGASAASSPGRGSGPRTRARRPRRAATSPRWPAGRSAPSSSCSIVDRSSETKKPLAERLRGSRRGARRVRSLGHGRSCTIALIVPPATRSTARATRRREYAGATPITNRETEMPLVSMRQLLDEAAAGGYGVGAFNVNNMEQIQAIMEAARETALARDHPGLARRARLHERPLPLAPDAGRGRALPGDPRRAPPRPRQRARRRASRRSTSASRA